MRPKFPLSRLIGLAVHLAPALLILLPRHAEGLMRPKFPLSRLIGLAVHLAPALLILLPRHAQEHSLSCHHPSLALGGQPALIAGLTEAMPPVLANPCRDCAAPAHSDSLDCPVCNVLAQLVTDPPAESAFSPPGLEDLGLSAFPGAFFAAPPFFPENSRSRAPPAG
ncbi:MAG: hypothetical protein LBU64_08730 [Planctomycetota bacterium]|jgi:hypothetical protein|nr:hypothetical protein [Planctomycetota bacterium]